MKIRILPSAMEDLSNGFQFYENQIPGLGSYFLETVFSDIDSLKLYAGIHSPEYIVRFMDTIVSFPKDFHMLFIIQSSPKQF